MYFVVEFHPPGAGDDDVDLLGILVLVPEGGALPPASAGGG